MTQIWSEKGKFQTWLDIEIAACEALAQKGEICPEVLHEIKTKADFNIDRINEIEADVHHDVIAFLTCVGEYVGPCSRFIHQGLTSTDIVDTGLSILLKNAGNLLRSGLNELKQALAEKALAHRQTLIMGRTHGVHAEIMTLGLKFLLWYEETRRNIHRLEQAVQAISVGKISGAVGTFAHLDPFVEAYVCQKFGLQPAAVSTQILQRDRHAEFLSVLAIIAGTLEKIATEIRHLQKTEVREVEEYFSQKQKGSSAMPHKRNPIIAERICGMARVIRGYALTGFENMALWHERDISHSSTERIIFPDATILLDYMIHKTKTMIAKLLIYPDNMLENMNKSRGLIYSQMVLLTLIRKGISREKAYEIVQRNAMNAWEKNRDFMSLLFEDRELTGILSRQEIENCFDPKHHLRHVDEIYQRVGLMTQSSPS